MLALIARELRAIVRRSWHGFPPVEAILKPQSVQISTCLCPGHGFLTRSAQRHVAAGAQPEFTSRSTRGCHVRVRPWPICRSLPRLCEPQKMLDLSRLLVLGVTFREQMIPAWPAKNLHAGTVRFLKRVCAFSPRQECTRRFATLLQPREFCGTRKPTTTWFARGSECTDFPLTLQSQVLRNWD